MGHRINPLFFRIGFSKDWSYQLRDPLLMNIFIYRLIRSLVFQYSAPYTSYKITRNTNRLHKYAPQPRVKAQGFVRLSKKHTHELLVQKKKVIRNPFQRGAFTFSHINISKSSSLIINIFLFDEAAERVRMRNKIPEKYFYCLSGKYYHRSRRWYSKFQKYHFHSNTGNRGKYIVKPWFFKSFRCFVNSRVYLKRLKTLVPRRRKMFKRVTQFERIFRSKFPKRKHDMYRKYKKARKYSRIRKTLPFRTNWYWKIKRNSKKSKKPKRYPGLLRLAFTKRRNTSMLIRPKYRSKKKKFLLKKRLTYQMRSLNSRPKSKFLTLRRRNGFVVKKKSRKKIGLQILKKKRKIKKNLIRGLISLVKDAIRQLKKKSRITVNGVKKKKNITNKKRLKVNKVKRFRVSWKSLYRIKSAYIYKYTRKAIKNALRVYSKNHNRISKFKYEMADTMRFLIPRLDPKSRVKPNFLDSATVQLEEQKLLKKIKDHTKIDKKFALQMRDELKKVKDHTKISDELKLLAGLDFEETREEMLKKMLIKDIKALREQFKKEEASKSITNRRRMSLSTINLKKALLVLYNRKRWRKKRKRRLLKMKKSYYYLLLKIIKKNGKLKHLKKFKYNKHQHSVKNQYKRKKHKIRKYYNNRKSQYNRKKHYKHKARKYYNNRKSENRFNKGKFNDEAYTRNKKLRKDIKWILRSKRKDKNTFLRKRYPFWLINTLSFIKKSLNYRYIIKHLKVLMFLLRYLKFYNKLISKKRVLYFNLLIQTLSSVVTLLPKNKMANRIYTFMHLCYLYLYSFRYLYFQYNKKIFQSRFIRFNLLSKLVIFSLKKIAFNLNNGVITLRYYGLHNRNYNAQFLLNYLLVKLGQYYKIKQIINPLINSLKRMPFIKGFRFIISGRLTRKERAFFIVKNARRMPLSSHNSKVDSAADFKIMKFGVVGIKIYLLYTDTPPYYYFFEFKNKL